MNYLILKPRFSRLVLEALITVQYVHYMHIGVEKVYGKTAVIPGRKKLLRDECKETGNLTKPLSGMASGKVFPESCPAGNNSGNDRIILK